MRRSQLFATCCVAVTHLASFGPMLHSDGNRAYFWTPIYVEAASSTLVRATSCADANAGHHAAGRGADRRERMASPHLTTRKRGRSGHSEGLSARSGDCGKAHRRTRPQDDRGNQGEI